MHTLTNRFAFYRDRCKTPERYIMFLEQAICEAARHGLRERGQTEDIEALMDMMSDYLSASNDTLRWKMEDE